MGIITWPGVEEQTTLLSGHLNRTAASHPPIPIHTRDTSHYQVSGVRLGTLWRSSSVAPAGASGESARETCFARTDTQDQDVGLRVCHVELSRRVVACCDVVAFFVQWPALDRAHTHTRPEHHDAQAVCACRITSRVLPARASRANKLRWASPSV